MANVTVVIDDADVRRMLERAPRRIISALKSGTEDATVYLLRQMKTYPPKPSRIQGTAFRPVRFRTKGGKNVSFMARAPEQYRRTNTLKRAWSRKVEVKRRGVIGRIGVNLKTVPYARYVQDRELQARVHQGRWHTVQDVAERSDRKIRAMYDARLRQELRR